jgi:glutamine synthetase
VTPPVPEPRQSAGLTAGRLERLIGKPRSDWTVGDLLELVRESGTRLVSLMHVGGDGWLKTLDLAPRSREHLRDLLTAGERADGSSLFRGTGIPRQASDIILRPRPDTAFMDPFAPLPTLVVLCGHASRDGAPLPESPDTIVHAAHAQLLEETGVDLQALGEVEYFLGKRMAERDIYGAVDAGYHAASPFVFGQALRREALATLAEMGIPVRYGHSEVGYITAEEDGRIWEQHEIELSLLPLPRAADAVVLTHWVIRNLAHRHDMLCSLEPALREGHAGSGLHVHFSPVQDGEHRGGRDASGELHPPARWLIGGLMQLGGSLMAFGNQRESSFLRLRQAREAPSRVFWGEFDRQALIRLPVVPRTPEGVSVTSPTVEFRLPDGSAHPHLLMAGVAQAMRQGRETKGLDELLARTSAGSLDPSRPPTAVPCGFAEVAQALAAHRQVLERGGVFPARMLDHTIQRLTPP